MLLAKYKRLKGSLGWYSFTFVDSSDTNEREIEIKIELDYGTVKELASTLDRIVKKEKKIQGY